MISFFNKSMPLYLPNVFGIRQKLKIMMMRYSASKGLQNLHRAQYYNKILHTQWHTQQKLIFSQLWRLEEQDQDASGVGSCETSLPDLQTSTFALHPLTAFPLCSHNEKKMPYVSFSSYKDVSPVRLQSYAYDLISS